jgi:hypothetical protein
MSHSQRKRFIKLRTYQLSVLLTMSYTIYEYSFSKNPLNIILYFTVQRIFMEMEKGTPKRNSEEGKTSSKKKELKYLLGL